MPHHHFFSRAVSAATVLTLGLVWGPAIAVLHADVLTSGSATIDYDKAAWDSLVGGNSTPGFEALLLDEAFDQAAANARTGTQILSDEVQVSPAYTGLVYDLNGTSVNNLADRYTQPTTFEFTPGALTSHTGSIGLGGVTRWDVNPLLGGGQLLFGDFTLAYDISRQAVGGSGWYLQGNIAPAGVVFDLMNVTTSDAGNLLTIAGDLTVSFEVANFLFGNPGDQGADVGDFSFTGVTVVPEPSVGMLLAFGALGCVLANRWRKRS